MSNAFTRHIVVVLLLQNYTAFNSVFRVLFMRYKT